MADSNFAEKPLLEKIQDLLERKPGMCDVAFCVGKEKKIVRALKVLLTASSPFLEKEFEEKWEVAVVKQGDGIPLPDFDPIAFELFVKLTSLDTWSLEILNTLSLPPHQTLNLLSICRQFEMKKPVEYLEKMATKFLQSFDEYKETDDFLQLSQTNLKFFLGSDDIEIKELDVFHAAMRWADFQCNQMKVEPTEEHIREVLGDSLFEIRFPLMTCAEFTTAAESKDILTGEENLGIYRFIGLDARKKLEFDAKKLPFKTTQRKQSVIVIPPGVSTLCLTQGSQILDNPPFVCDGSQNINYIACEKNFTVHGIGFLGPIESDGFYDVKVQVKSVVGVYDSGVLEKRIFAKRSKTFYFLFDAPLELEAGSVTEWTTRYMIGYRLKGADTSAFNRSICSNSTHQETGTMFRFAWHSNQLVEILFKLS